MEIPVVAVRTEGSLRFESSVLEQLDFKLSHIRDYQQWMLHLRYKQRQAFQKVN